MCFPTRKLPSLIVSGLSAVVVILGLILLIMAIIFQTGESVLTADMGDLSDFAALFRNGIFAVVLIFSLLALAVGAFGVGFQCKPCRKSPCGFAVCYGISIGLIWIVFIIVGSIVTAVSTVSSENIGKMCDGDASVGDGAAAYFSDIDGLLNNQTANNMCSTICPCDSAAAAPWMALDEATLNYWNRTKSPTTTAAQRAKDITSLDVSGSVVNYLDCFAAVDEEINDLTGVKIIRFFEGKYSCSGVCTTGLFFMSLDLSKGVPDETCLAHIQTEIKGSMQYIGITVLLSGVFMFFVWVFQYCLWKKFDSDPYEDI